MRKRLLFSCFAVVAYDMYMAGQKVKKGYKRLWDYRISITFYNNFHTLRNTAMLLS